jgi:hypothetical protein
MILAMSRAKNYLYLLCVPFVLLPLLSACGSSPKPTPAKSADEADSKTSAKDEEAGLGHDTAKAESESSAPEDKAEKKPEKKLDAEGEDATPVDDSRTTESVNKIFKDNRKSFKKCYEEVRKDKPELKGNVVLKVVLDAEGKVKKAYVEESESSIHEQKIDDCMIKLAKSLSYPKSSKGLEKDFEYDFGFNNMSK